jgi:site-specific DNA-methyltransferase (adenine-specific)
MAKPMTPYYDRDGITIYHGDCRDILPTLPPVDLVLTDPPYSPEWHSGARSMTSLDETFIDFASISDASWLETISPLVRRWVVATMDWRHIAKVAEAPPEGLRFVRFGVWAKPNGAPQFTGDRPGPGWEGIAFLHREGGRMKWNGGGRSSVFTVPRIDGAHPTEKPIRLYRDFVALFSDPGETILDPFMGSGTTLRAAMDLGRKAIGIEIEERYCEIAVKRLQQQVLQLDVA